MKKNDLKNGMVVEMKTGLYVVINDVFVNNDGYMNIDSYTEDLIFEEDSEDFTVNKVFKVDNWGGFNYVFNPTGRALELLWERAFKKVRENESIYIEGGRINIALR